MAPEDAAGQGASRSEGGSSGSAGQQRRSGGSSQRRGGRRRGGRGRGGRGQGSPSSSGGGQRQGSPSSSGGGRGNRAPRTAQASSAPQVGRGGDPTRQGRPSVPEAAVAPTLSVPRPDDARGVVRSNRRRATTLTLGTGVVAGVVAGLIIGFTLGLVAGVVAAVVVAVAVAAVVWWAAPALTLRLIGAQAVSAGHQPRLENLVDGLCASFGITPPRLMMVTDEVANACAVGTARGATSLVVTTGLLQRLDLIELEGVVAHELAHIKRGDTVVSSVATVVLGPVAFLLGDDRRLHRTLGLGREFCADDVAVSTVRYPPGLQRALEEMAGVAASPGSLFASRRLLMMRWIWVNPVLASSTSVTDSVATSDLPTQSTVGGSVAAPGAAGPPARDVGLGLEDQLDLPKVRAAALAQR